MGEQAVPTFFCPQGCRRGRGLTEPGHSVNELGARVAMLHSEVDQQAIFVELKSIESGAVQGEKIK